MEIEHVPLIEGAPLRIAHEEKAAVDMRGGPSLINDIDITSRTLAPTPAKSTASLSGSGTAHA